MMVENHDYVALEWVKGEIEDTLNQALQALEAYSETPDDSTRLRFCLNYLHQVRGTLQMVEFYGAALMAEEMEALTKALLQHSTPNPEESQQLLMQSLLKLPSYLDHIKNGRRDLPLVLLPDLNDMRSARCERLLTETSLFTPDLSPAKASNQDQALAQFKDANFQNLVRKLRQMYQFSLLCIIRNEKLSESLSYFAKVFIRLEKLCANTALAQLWWICSGLVEGIANSSIKLSPAVNALLKSIDKEIKRVADQGAEALNVPSSDDLLKNLLFYIAKSPKDTPRIRGIKQAYSLDQALPNEQALDLERARFKSPDSSVMSSVVAVLTEEIGRIKDILDLFVRSANKDPDGLSEVLPILTKIADAMGVLSLGIPRQVIQEQIQVIKNLLDAKTSVNNSTIMDIAGALLYVEASLAGIAEDGQRVRHQTSDNSHSQAESIISGRLTDAQRAALTEARNGLEQAKDGITEFITTQGDQSYIKPVPRLLSDVAGGLSIIPMERAASILNACSQYVQDHLIEQQRVPDWRTRDTLADAIIGVDYYLERILENTENIKESMLDVAEESVAKLGYPIAPESSDMGDRAASNSEDVELPASSENRPDTTSLDLTKETFKTDDTELVEPSVQNLHDEAQSVTPDEQHSADNIAYQEPEESIGSNIDTNIQNMGVLDGNLNPNNILEQPWNEASENKDIPTLDEIIDEAHLSLDDDEQTLSFADIEQLSIDDQDYSFTDIEQDTTDPNDNLSSSEADEWLDESLTSSTVQPSSESQYDPQTSDIIDHKTISPLEHASDSKDDSELEVFSAEEDDAEEESLIDDEIIEIFLEEAEEVLETIHEFYPQWQADLSDLSGSATELRRAFHTLKGSGRMVEAHDIGELAWSIENLLNRVLEKSIEADSRVLDIITRVIDLLPGLIEAFKNHQAPPVALDAYETYAHQLARSEAVGDFQGTKAASVPSEAEAEAEAEAAIDPQLVEPVPSVTTTIHEPVESTQEPASTFVDDPEPIEIDEQLFEIFASETEGHLELIDTFIGRAEHAYEPIEIDEGLQRALHTLKGSAHMAGITSIASIATPLEKFIKNLRAHLIKADNNVIVLLKNGSKLIQKGVDLLSEDPQAPLHGKKHYLHELELLYDKMLSHLMDDDEMDATVNGTKEHKASISKVPPLSAIFMSEGMDILLNARNLIEQWRKSGYKVSDSLELLNHEVTLLEDSAKQAELVEIVSLAQCLMNVYQVILEDTISKPASIELSKLLIESHDMLINMMDQVAAQQAVAPADLIINRLNTWLSDDENAAYMGIDFDDNLELDQFLDDSLSLDSGPSQSNAPTLVEQMLQEHANQQSAKAKSIQSKLQTKKAPTSFNENNTAKPRNKNLTDSPLNNPLAEQSNDLPLTNDQEIDLDSLTIEDTDFDDLMSADYDNELTPLDMSEESDEFNLNDFNDPQSVVDIDDSSLDDTFDINTITLDSLDDLNSMLNNESNKSDGAVNYEDGPKKSAADPVNLEEVIWYDEFSNELDQEGTEIPEGTILSWDNGLNILPSGSDGIDSDASYHPQIAAQALKSITEEEQQEQEKSLAIEYAKHTNALPEPELLEIEDNELLEIFLEEAQEIIEDASQALHHWQSDEGHSKAVGELMRHLHTLKGGARMAELTEFGDLSHELEFLYEAAKNKQLSPSRALFDLLHQCHDRLAQMVELLRTEQKSLAGQDLVEKIKQYLADPETFSIAVEHNTRISPSVETEVEVETVDAKSNRQLDSTEPPEKLLRVTLDPDVDPEILDVFLEESEELLESIDRNIHGWKSNHQETIHNEELLRHLHTFKGGARLSRLVEVGNLCHNFETLLIDIQQLKKAPDQKDFADILSYQDRLVNHIDAVRNALKNPHTYSNEQEKKQVQLATADKSSEIVASAMAALKSRDNANTINLKGMDPSLKKNPQEMMRISSDLLERLVNLAGETSIFRGRIEQQVNDFSFSLEEMETTIERIHEQLRRLDIETQAQVMFTNQKEANSDYADFDPLEMDRYNHLQQLSRSLLESASDMLDLKKTLGDKRRDAETLLLQQSRVNTELQENLMQARMVPFSRLVPRLRRIVRQVAGELNKRVDFDIVNAEGEMDRSLLERMTSPLEHLLRNAVDHGIESVEKRRKTHKPDAGKLLLSLSREGGDVVIEIRDDGAGINIGAVRKKAIERGLITADMQLADHDIQQFILHAGFSTAQKITQISGRGVGMDVVHSEIKAMGGNISINSKQDFGTKFIIRLPFTVSINRALMVKISDELYAIPLNTIEGIVRVNPMELEKYYRSSAPAFEYAGEPYKLQYMGSLINNSQLPITQGSVEPVPVILARGQDISVALQVDSILGSREIVVKTLGAQFSQLRGVSGATILGDGSVVVILDLLAMVRSDFEVSSTLSASKVIPKELPSREDRVLTVMVVDDSVTVRKVTTRVLERNGMKVITAKDGVDAVAQLQEVKPDLMLLDIEMPRMDGFEVASLVRHDSRLRDLPIIMITSRTGSKHHDKAMSIGVNKYLGKPFQEAKLMTCIEELLVD